MMKNLTLGIIFLFLTTCGLENRGDGYKNVNHFGLKPNSYRAHDSPYFYMEAYVYGNTNGNFLFVSFDTDRGFGPIFELQRVSNTVILLTGIADSSLTVKFEIIESSGDSVLISDGNNRLWFEKMNETIAVPDNSLQQQSFEEAFYNRYDDFLESLPND